MILKIMYSDVYSYRRGIQMNRYPDSKKLQSNKKFHGKNFSYRLKVKKTQKKKSVKKNIHQSTRASYFCSGNKSLLSKQFFYLCVNYEMLHNKNF